MVRVIDCAVKLIIPAGIVGVIRCSYHVEIHCNGEGNRDIVMPYCFRTFFIFFAPVLSFYSFSDRLHV
jgi:hypothetical protein